VLGLGKGWHEVWSTVLATIERVEPPSETFTRLSTALILPPSTTYAGMTPVQQTEQQQTEAEAGARDECPLQLKPDAIVLNAVRSILHTLTRCSPTPVVSSAFACAGSSSGHQPLHSNCK
jgi:hypothetical protein